MFFLKLYERVASLERSIGYGDNERKRLQDQIWALTQRLDRLAEFVGATEERINIVRYVKKQR